MTQSLTSFATGADSAHQVIPGTVDPLIGALLWICDHYGQPRTRESLMAGLPQGARMTVPLATRALEQQGFSVGVVKRDPAELFSYLLPAILLLKDGSACVLLRRVGGVSRRARKGASGDAGATAGTFEIMLPETGGGTVQLTGEELADRYSGVCLLVKPAAKVDARAGDPLPETPSHWLWTTLWRYKKYYTSTIFAALLINVLTLAGTFFTMNVYDRVVPNQAYATLWSLAIGAVIAMSFEFAARYLRGTLIDVAGKKADLILGSILFRQALAVRLEHRPASAGSFANQLREFESVRDFATSATLATLTDLPFVFLFIAVIYVIGGQLAIVPLLAIPIVILVSALIQWPLARVMREHLREQSLKHGVLIESVEGIETLKATAGEGYMQKRWEECSALTSQSSMKSRTLSSLAMSFVTFVQQVETVVIIVWGVYLIHAGQMSMGALIGTVILAGRAVAPLGQVVGLAVRFQQAKAALESLNKLMEMPTDRDGKRSYLTRPNLTGSLQVRDLNFSYPAPPTQPNPKVLKSVNLTIKGGERIAILGRIGSGKSTLLRVLAGLYQPVQGQVLADGIDIKQIDPADWRASVGFVGQDARLFYGSMRENIMIGRPSASPEEFLQVCRLTGLDRLAASHPLGFELPVGEMGQGLSGGQRQLVALARCMLSSPQILMMDEPTSAMDGQTEAFFMQQLMSVTQGRTFLLVTHRPSLLALVERIIVVDDGMIVADGPKDQVLAALAANSAAQQEQTRAAT